MEWYEEDGITGLFCDDDDNPVATITIVADGATLKFAPHVGRAMLDVAGREPQFYDTIEEAKEIAEELFLNAEEVEEGNEWDGSLDFNV
jgi:hypothetical protein